MSEKITIPDAIKVLRESLAEDKSEGSYYYSWQANIAIAFKDEFRRSMEAHQPNALKWLFKKNGLHEISNNAAKNFLDLLIK